MPNAVSLSPTYGTTLEQFFLNALKTVPGAAPLATATLKLYSARSQPITRDIAAADFTESTFDGYAAQALAAITTAIILLTSGRGWGSLLTLTFLMTGSTQPENVQGYWIEDGSGNTLMVEDFPAPIPMLTTGNFIQLDLIFPATDPQQAT